MKSSPKPKHRRIWIDLDNSPHVPFFAPIIAELRRRGHDVLLTSRDNAQVRELVALHGLESVEIGHHFGRNKISKILRTFLRSLRLVAMMSRHKPDMALSHGSRSQILGALLLGVPSVVVFDYEFTSSVGIARATWDIAPEAIPRDITYTDVRHSLRYPGIKEDVYVSTFRPDPALRSQLGLRTDDLVVTIRPPANEAHYHNPQSDWLLQQVVEFVLQEGRARIVLLPRTRNQGIQLRKEWSHQIADERIVIPEHAVEGLNLIWNSDLVISGGGTMNREAAALGVPVYSIFRGAIGAVDRYLVSEGRLILIENEDDIRNKVQLIRRSPVAAVSPRPAFGSIVAHIATILETEGK